ncbi:MAG: Gfo/Idh/MocA family oxidoreductase [Pirellulales bacterium]
MTRLALVGYGRIAPKHLAVFRALGAQIVAACNRSAAGRQQAETEGGIPHTYAQIGEMLERERPDGVLCCASSDTQFAAAQEVLPYGIPTLLEKPPGLSLAEYETLCETAARHATPVMVAMNRRHYSVLRRAIDDAGGLSAVESVAVEWSENPRHFLARGFSIERASREVFSNSLHGLDLLTLLAGTIDDATVTGLNFGEPLRWMMALQGVSERGVLATFNSTWDSPGRWRLSFCSAGRRYVFAPLETCQVSEFGTNESRAIEPDAYDHQFKPGFYGQAQAFLEMIATRKAPPLVSLEAVGPAMRLAGRLTDACLRAGEAPATAVTASRISLGGAVDERNGAPAAAPAQCRDRSAEPPALPLRIVVLADSLAMARAEPVLIRWEDTWPARLSAGLRAAGVACDVINCGARARTADQLLGWDFEEHVVYKRPDVVILQVGIVDCSPRIFSKRERALLNRGFVPARLRDWMVARRSARREALLRQSHPLRKVYTPPQEFAACLQQFAARLAQVEHVPRLIVLPILCDPQVMNVKSPGHTENVALYNGLLRTIARAAGADWLEPGELIRDQEVAESFASDGYHLSVAGSARCAQALAELLAAPPSAPIAPPAALSAGTARSIHA